MLAFRLRRPLQRHALLQRTQHRQRGMGTTQGRLACGWTGQEKQCPKSGAGHHRQSHQVEEQHASAALSSAAARRSWRAAGRGWSPVRRRHGQRAVGLAGWRAAWRAWRRRRAGSSVADVTPVRKAALGGSQELPPTSCSSGSCQGTPEITASSSDCDRYDRGAIILRMTKLAAMRP